VAARRRRASGRGARSGPKNQLWSAVISENVALAAAAVSNDDIVAPTDWVVGVGLEHATVLRCRGFLSVVPDGAADGALFAAIVKVDDAVADLDPGAIATYTTEDVLWSWCLQWEASSIGAPAQTVIDVKAMRRISTQDSIRLCLSAVGTQARVSFICRALVRRGGN